MILDVKFHKDFLVSVSEIDRYITIAQGINHGSCDVLGPEVNMSCATPSLTTEQSSDRFEFFTLA